eukprot:Em0003g466a
MASQAQKHSGGQTSDDVKSLRTKVRQMEERIIELEKAVERIDVLEERLAQISLSHGTLQNEDRSDGASKGAECTGAKAVIPLDYYASRRNTVLTKGNAEKTKKRRLALKRSRLTLFARDKAVKDAIEAGEVDAKDIESIKKVRAAVPTVPLPETLAAGSDHEEEEERTVYQKKRLLSLEVARASRVRGVGAGTSHSHEHEIAHRPELTAAGAATSSNSDTD